MDDGVFFAGWSGLVRVAIVGTLAYVALVLLLRVSGKRTLSKMNAFDLVVTVALGSTLATVILSKDVALVEGGTAFALLVGLQFGITWLSVRSASVRRLVKAEPTLLLYQGSVLPDQLQRSETIEVFGSGVPRFGGQMFEHASILVKVSGVRQIRCAKESKICAGPAYDRRLPVIL